MSQDRFEGSNHEKWLEQIALGLMKEQVDMMPLIRLQHSWEDRQNALGLHRIAECGRTFGAKLRQPLL